MEYRVAVRNNHFPRVGEIVVLDEAAEADWAFEIAKGFLVPTGDPNTAPAPELHEMDKRIIDEQLAAMPGDPDADVPAVAVDTPPGVRTFDE